MSGELAEQQQAVLRATQHREQLEDELRARQLTLVSELQSIYPLEERRVSTPDGKMARRHVVVVVVVIEDTLSKQLEHLSYYALTCTWQV